MPDFTITLTAKEAKAVQVLADLGYGVVQTPEGDQQPNLTPQELVQWLIRRFVYAKRSSIDKALRSEELTEAEVKAAFDARTETEPRARIYE